MWRPLFRRRKRLLLILERVDAADELRQCPAQSIDLLLLAIRHIAQLLIGLLQERNFELEALDVSGCRTVQVSSTSKSPRSLEYFLGMSRHLHLAPFLAKYAAGVD